MFFCPKCNYALNITKDIKKDEEGISVDDFIDTIVEGDIVEGNLQFSFDQLKKSGKYKKLSVALKKKVTGLYKKLSKPAQVGTGAFFVCDKCGYTSTVQKGTMIYKKGYNKKITVKTDEDYQLKCADPTLPRTKDYICKNKQCASHKDLVNKEAVFYRAKDEFNLTYVCCMCYTGWVI